MSTRTGTGDVVHAWEELHADVPATVAALSGREFYDAQRVNAELTHKVVMRYLPGITTHMRIEHDGVTLDIDEPPVDKDFRHQWLTLMCKFCD